MKTSRFQRIVSYLLAALFLCGSAGCKKAPSGENKEAEPAETAASETVLTSEPIDIVIKETPQPEAPADIPRILYDLAAAYAAGDPEKRLPGLFSKLSSADAELCAKWQDVFAFTDSCLGDMQLHEDVLPDGLNDTDTLCIIVLGYQLNRNGTMAEELLGRLRVALKSAEKYPNAKILCTGGATSADHPELTEADSMAEWLIQNGITEDRILVENESRSTVENAKFTFRILSEQCPNVKEAAIVSSDYHIPRGSVYMAAKFILGGDSNPVRIVSNAAYRTKLSEETSKLRFARGILSVADDPGINKILEEEGFAPEHQKTP